MQRNLLWLACLALSIACSGAGDLPIPDEASRSEFLALAEHLEQGDNAYFGKRSIADLELQLEDETLQDPNRFFLLMRLADLQTRQGMLDEATSHADQAVALVAGPAAQAGPGSELSKALAAAHLVRTLAYLRLGEQQNCIAHRGVGSCIFPVAGDGVYADPASAEQAFESLRRFLEQNPGDVEARWLINVVAMALGRHPQGVEARHRIDPHVHDAVADVPRFTDVAPRLGIAALELAGGVVADDFEGDGLIDIATSTSDPRGSLRLYRNLGDGSFIDRTVEAGLDTQLGGLNMIGGDYDGDGDVDLLVLRGAWHFADGRMRNSLLRNDRGRFTDVTREAGLAEPARPTQAACWADFDNDGDLDLYVGNEAWAPLDLDFPSQLFRNNGDGTFTDVAAAAGVANHGYAKGVTVGDYDDDGDLDLYVSNVGANRLYRNDGDLSFTDIAPEAGLTGPLERSFAPWFFDHDNDGDLDLFVGAYEGLLSDVARDYLGQPYEGPAPALYRNDGNGSFTDVATVSGLGRPWMPMGANFGDLDNDGFLDLYLGTGNPNLKTLVPNAALLNEGGSRFADVTVASGLGHLQKGHGIAFADFDHDGDQDIYHQLGGFYPSDAFGNALFVNPGNRGAQVGLELRGTRSNRLAVGARITLVVETPQGSREIHRAIGSVSSFGGSPLGRIEIGIGGATGISELRVRWPGTSDTVTYRGVSTGNWYRVTEGRAEVEALSISSFSLDVSQ